VLPMVTVQNRPTLRTWISLTEFTARIASSTWSIFPSTSSGSTTCAIRATSPKAIGSSSNFWTAEPCGRDCWILDFRSFRSKFASLGNILIDARTLANSLRPHVLLQSGSGIAAFHATVRPAEHSALLTPPDCYLAAAGAWELDCSFSRKYCPCTPRASRHSDDFLTRDGDRCAQ